MADLLTALTSIAVTVFRQRNSSEYDSTGADLFDLFWLRDPVLKDAYRTTAVRPDQHPEIAQLSEQIFTDPDMASLAPRDDELDPMLMHPGGGFRASPASFVAGLFSSALLQMYFLRLPVHEGTFVRTVLEGFDEFRRAARGEGIRAHLVLGIAGLTLREGQQATTPWGTLRPAPPDVRDGGFFTGFQPQTTSLLTEVRLLPVRFDRAPEPKSDFDPKEATAERANVLFPLACALASSDSKNPAVPIITWSTLLMPFQHGPAYSSPILPPRLKPEVDITTRIADVEEWSRIVEESHTASVDVAARRLVSATSARMDPADALIDAVMVWENLVGTTAETTFRVTASLSKALEPDRNKRRDLRKALGKVYDIRSKVVHGVAVDEATIDEAARKAIDVAVRILAISYRRGPAWLGLSSTERADTLLLEEP